MTEIMFNMDIIHSGTKSNIVPDLCTLTINRRVIPDENIDDVKKEIAEAIDRGKSKSKLLDVRTTYDYHYPPMISVPTAPAIIRMIKVIMEVQNITKEEVKVFGAAGSTDMGFVSEILNKDDIIFYGVGKTKYMAYQAIITNGTVYVVAFFAYLTGMWTPTFTSIMILFGIGIVVDSILTVYYAFHVLFPKQRPTLQPL